MCTRTVTTAQINLPYDERRSLLKELDRDGSREIDYREFSRFLRTKGKGRRSESSRPSSPREYTIADSVAKQLRDKFDAAIDSGKIKSYEDVFRAMDRDDNGRVSYSEFEDGLRDLRVGVRVYVCACVLVCMCGVCCVLRDV